MNAIGNIIGVSTQSIMRWIRMFYDKFIPQNEIETKSLRDVSSARHDPNKIMISLLQTYSDVVKWH